MRGPGKPVYLGEIYIGHAITWRGVGEALGRYLGRDFEAVRIQDFGSEGPSGFYLQAAIAQLGARRLA